MADITVEYIFYADEYGGTLSEEAFLAQRSAAISHVQYLIGLNSVDSDDKLYAVRMAACAVIDVFNTYGVSNIGSGFTIGSFSMNGSGDGVNPKQLATDAAYEYLASAGLLWSGVR